MSVEFGNSRIPKWVPNSSINHTTYLGRSCFRRSQMPRNIETQPPTAMLFPTYIPTYHATIEEPNLKPFSFRLTTPSHTYLPPLIRTSILLQSIDESNDSFESSPALIIQPHERPPRTALWLTFWFETRTVWSLNGT